MFAEHGYDPDDLLKWPVATFLRRWEMLCTHGLAPETAADIRDLVNIEELAQQPHLQDLIETRQALDPIDAKKVWEHHERLNDPSLTSQQRIQLQQAEQARREKLLEQRYG